MWDGYRVRAGHGTTGPVVCQKQPPRGDQEVSGVFGKRGEGCLGEALRVLGYSTCDPWDGPEG